MVEDVPLVKMMILVMSHVADSDDCDEGDYDDQDQGVA